MKPYHRARRMALQALCCLDSQGEHAMDLAQRFIRESREGLDAQDLAHQLLDAAWRRREASDQRIARHSHRWGVSRMPLVDRNILRLAVAELDGKAAPPAVIIREAIRLAREFSTSESPRFVNGVLDAIAKDNDDTTGQADDENAVRTDQE